MLEVGSENLDERRTRHLEALLSCEKWGIDPDLSRCDVCGAVSDCLLIVGENQWCEFCGPAM